MIISYLKSKFRNDLSIVVKYGPRPFSPQYNVAKYFHLYKFHLQIFVFNNAQAKLK